jgi:hypothetical protein
MKKGERKAVGYRGLADEVLTERGGEEFTFNARRRGLADEALTESRIPQNKIQQT